jgi:hypothetical protein
MLLLPAISFSEDIRYHSMEGEAERDETVRYTFFFNSTDKCYFTIDVDCDHVELYITGKDIKYKKHLPLNDVVWWPPYTGEYYFQIINYSVGRDCDYKIDLEVHMR